MRLTCIAGIGGLPQVTVPVGTLAGAPAGLSFIGWAGSDEVLLELALSLARLAGSSHKREE
jgi:amidase